MSDPNDLLSHRSISLAAAQRLVAVAEAGAHERGARVSIAVVDHGGHLVAFRRMDGAYPGSVDAALGKARSCAGFRTPLAEFGRMARREPWVGDLPGLIPLGGAVPIWAGEDGQREFVGAVSVSGDTEEHEQQLAERAAAAFAGGTAPPRPRGIEHIGITVPDIDAAETFLHRAFDARTLYSLVRKDEPPMGDDLARSQNGLADGTAMRALRMMRIGDGPNVELFELTGYRREDSAIINDMGLTHFSMYCDDLEAVADRFVAAGGAMLHGPNDLVRQEGGDGNRFWFGRCPWGTLIEFIRFPTDPATDPGHEGKRWRPDDPA